MVSWIKKLVFLPIQAGIAYKSFDYKTKSVYIPLYIGLLILIKKRTRKYALNIAVRTFLQAFIYFLFYTIYWDGEHCFFMIWSVYFTTFVQYDYRNDIKLDARIYFIIFQRYKQNIYSKIYIGFIPLKHCMLQILQS